MQEASLFAVATEGEKVDPGMGKYSSAFMMVVLRQVSVPASRNHLGLPAGVSPEVRQPLIRARRDGGCASHDRWYPRRELPEPAR